VRGAVLGDLREQPLRSRSYGYAKLSELIEAATLFETDQRSPGDGKQAVICIRDKRRRSAGKSFTARSSAAKSSAAKKASGTTGASTKAKA
jgi:hypothetical protein